MYLYTFFKDMRKLREKYTLDDISLHKSSIIQPLQKIMINKYFTYWYINAVYDMQCYFYIKLAV